MEGAFQAFGGIPHEVLLDNARALIVHHDPSSREVVLHPRLHAFARHWGFRVRACAPYRARTKGKDERGVGYVKNNAIAGRGFASWGQMEAHLACWSREIADQRIHGTTGEAPIERFQRDEARALKPLAGMPAFGTMRDLSRIVGGDCAVALDGNAYSVPWRLIGERVRVIASAGTICIQHGGQEVARHVERERYHGRVDDDAHLAGLVGSRSVPMHRRPEIPACEDAAGLLRPLAEYEAIAGGSF
jgi:hypothetical protein